MFTVATYTFTTTPRSDFDMSCNLDKTSPEEAPGSLGFMAPEAMIKNVPDATKLDVWSIGCVLLEMVGVM